MADLAFDGIVPPLLVAGFAALLILAARIFLGRRAASPAAAGAIIVAVVAFAALVELGMGRTPTYKKGPVRLWSGEVQSDQNSQQIADPYTFTHVVHGVLFYALTRALPGSVWLRAVVATSVEAAWEVLENTDMVIQRYRAATISLDYYGDSVVNSVFDILTSVLGFALAYRLSVRMTMVSTLVMEAALAVWIRDNLTLNIVMLLYPLDAIKAWQSGG